VPGNPLLAALLSFGVSDIFFLRWSFLASGCQHLIVSLKKSLAKPKRLGYCCAAMKNTAAQSLGRKGGKVTSESKAAAARANGKKGGRPTKEMVADALSGKEDGTADAGFDGLCERHGYAEALRLCGR